MANCVHEPAIDLWSDSVKWITPTMNEVGAVDCWSRPELKLADRRSCFLPGFAARICWHLLPGLPRANIAADATRIGGDPMSKFATLLLLTTLPSCAANHQPASLSLAPSDSRYAAIASRAVKKRAAYDFSCVEKRIALTHIGSTKWGASGCNERHVYAVDCRSRQSPGPAEASEHECVAILMGPQTQAH